MSALELLAVLYASLGVTEGSVFQFAHQFWVDGDLLGGDGVQVSHAVHMTSTGGHVQRRVVVVVQAPHVCTERHQKRQAVLMTVRCRQMKGRVSPNITFVWISSGDGKTELGIMHDRDFNVSNRKRNILSIFMHRNVVVNLFVNHKRKDFEKSGFVVIQ